MFVSLPSSSKALPREFRSAAEKLFPSKGFKPGKGPTVEAAAAFAEILGIGGEFKRLFNSFKSDKAAGDILNRFQNNLDLLIQKTWVEKADEARKNALQDKIPPFVSLIEKGDYIVALEEFGEVLEELAYLFFGVQSQSDDFAEYALRIDPRIGLFWWYGGQLKGFHGAPWLEKVDQSVLYSLLLLGICYLTDF
jgi:hypothetical protein